MSVEESQGATSEVERLTEVVRELRNEIEVLNQQQAHLQMQVSILLGSAGIQDPGQKSRPIRNRLVSIFKSNPRLYKFAFNLRRHLKR